MGFFGRAATAEYGVGKDEPRGIGAPVDNFWQPEISTVAYPEVLPIIGQGFSCLFSALTVVG